MADIIIVDTEFTAWEGSMARGWSGPNEYMEIIQIGAVRLDGQTLTEKERLNILVRPVRNPVLSAYITNLTGITQEQVDQKGVDFAAALAALTTFCKDASVFCYGRDDAVLAENIRLNSLPASVPVMGDIRPWFQTCGFDTSTATSGQVAEKLGLSITGPAHDALNDVRSVATGIRHFRQKGFSAPQL